MKKKINTEITYWGKNIREVLFGPENSLSDTPQLNEKHDQTDYKQNEKEKKEKNKQANKKAAKNQKKTTIKPHTYLSI